MAEQELVPAGTTAAVRFGGPMSGVRGFVNQPAVRRSLPVIGTVAALALAALAWWSFQTPAQRPLYEGLAESDKAAVASALQSAGIAYTLDASTGAMSVSDIRRNRSRADCTCADTFFR